MYASIVMEIICRHEVRRHLALLHHQSSFPFLHPHEHAIVVQPAQFPSAQQYLVAYPVYDQLPSSQHFRLDLYSYFKMLRRPEFPSYLQPHGCDNSNIEVGEEINKIQTNYDHNKERLPITSGRNRQPVAELRLNGIHIPYTSKNNSGRCRLVDCERYTTFFCCNGHQ